MKYILLSVIATAVLVGGGAFYGGMEYAKSQSRAMGDFAPNFGDIDMSQLPNMPGGGGGFNRGGAASGGFASGKILSIDDESITIKLPDGGSKLIFFSDASEITKSTEGSTEDLVTGKTITVIGKNNDDGSVTATSLQILPEGLASGTPSPSPIVE